MGGAVRTAAADLASLLLDHPFADDALLLHGTRTSMSAGAVRAAARAQADDLRSLGVQARQGVAVSLPNGPDAVVAMFAVWLAGAVLVPVNPRSPATERDHLLAATGPAALIDVDGAATLGRAAAPRTFEPGTAFVLWTSGTTGRPKPILHTHAGYLELLDRVLGPLRGSAPRDPNRPVSPNLIPVPLALNAGLYNALFGLRAGAPLVIMDGFDPATFAELVARFAIRSTVLPPAAIAALTADASVSDLAPLRYVRSITAPLSPLAARRFTERFGVAVLNGYGQAEIGEVIGWTAADAREHPDKVGAVGRAHPGVEVKVTGPDPIGPLWVKPASMAAGYASGDDLADRLDADGFLDTGDLARIDDDGFVWIEGRAGDLINRGGNKVFPEQVEEVLELAPGVREAAVVGQPDDRLGEVPVAFLVGPGGPGTTDDDLVALCRTHLAAYKVPVAFQWVDALPRSEIGKVLRRQLASTAPIDPSPTSPVDERPSLASTAPAGERRGDEPTKGAP